MSKRDRRAEKAVQFLLGYWWSRRGVGHTTATLEGAKSCDCILLTHDQASAERLRREGAVGAMSISMLPKGIQGERRPLVLDHYAIGLLLQDLLQTLRYQRNERDALREALEQIQNMTADAGCCRNRDEDGYQCRSCAVAGIASRALDLGDEGR